MSWIFAVLGALIGLVLSDSRSVSSAVLAAGLGWLAGALLEMQRRLAEVEAELSNTRAALTAGPVRPPVVAEPLPPPVAAPPPVVAPSQVTAPPPPPAPAPSEPAAPGWEERALAAARAWLTQGNVPVKVGVLVLFFGVAAALRYAAAEGYLRLPIELRLAAIAAAAVGALFVGWRERTRRPAFGLSLQGGALGVLLLTVFAAFRVWALLPAGAAFALVGVLVAGAALLAVLQRALALAVLGFLGGYLAPVLLSTGGGSHVALFSYYAVLNAAVFALAWRQRWRLLNLVGFAFTFGVGTAWGARAYRPELFWSTEPFLVLFFLAYVTIGLLYVLRQEEHPQPWVDGTLVFGPPLLAFPLQAVLLKDDRLALALSAVAVGALYAGLVFVLHRRRSTRLLAEAYAALALGFATLAVPLAFSARTTAGLWALEGAGVAWLGVRQKRTLPWVSGLLLQWLAAGSFALSVALAGPGTEPLLLNAHFLGALLLALSGWTLSLVHDRHRPVPALAALLFAWGTAWWLGAIAHEWDAAALAPIGRAPLSLLLLAATLLGAGLLRAPLAWPRLEVLAALAAWLGLPLVLLAVDAYGDPLAPRALPAWGAFFAAAALALWRLRARGGRATDAAHLGVLWTLAFAATVQLERWAENTLRLASGWVLAAVWLPLGLMSLALWRRPAWAAWPRQGSFARTRAGWFAPALGLLALFWTCALFTSGNAAPLPYVPLLNPLELSLLAIAALLLGFAREHAALRPLWRAGPLLGFAFVSLATLRAVHHLHGEPWGLTVLDSRFAQTSLTVAWSLMGVGAWVLGSRRRDRALWTGGATLMGAVLLKLVAVDRQHVGNLEGIVSFLAVGLLLVGVGYVAPSPPRTDVAGAP